MRYQSNVNVWYDLIRIGAYTICLEIDNYNPWRAICLETLSEDRDGWCRCDVRWWSDTRTRTRRRSVRDTSALVPKCQLDTSAPSKNVETVRHWCRSVPKTLRHRQKKVRHFGTKDIVPNCLGSEVSIHRNSDIFRIQNNWRTNTMYFIFRLKLLSQV